MAQLLYDRDSTKIHLNSTKRHTRLCRHVPGTEVLIKAIETQYNALIEKQNETLQAEENRETAYDDVQFHDNVMDDKVHSAFEQCKQYDRDNPGRSVLKSVFTEGKYSGIVNAALTREADMVAGLVARLESLGADHQLNRLVAYLQEGIDKCREALANYHNAIRKQKEAEAQEEIAKSNLAKQYEFNYLDSVKMFGKSFANRLFPVIHSSRKNQAGKKEKEITQTDKQESTKS